MRIIHISSVFPPYRAGTGNVVWNLTRELARRGHEVTVLTPRYRRELLGLDVVEDIEVRRIDPLLKYGNGAFIPGLYKHLVKMCQQVPSPVVHLHMPFGGGQEMVWLAKKLRRMFGARFIVQYHHDWQLNWFTRILGLPAKMTFSSLIKAADAVVVSSLDYARNSGLSPLFTKEGLTPDVRGQGEVSKPSEIDPQLSAPRADNSLLIKGRRVVEIPFGVDTKRFKTKYYASKPRRDEPLRLIITAALDLAHHFKGIDILLQALARLEPGIAHLTVMGKGELKEYYERLARQLGISDHVSFLGFISDKELPQQLRAADVFVFPSMGRAEAFGLVALEAMASGLPVIASAIPGVRTLFASDELIVEPGNIEDLATKINLAVDNRAALREFGKANRKLVEEKYTWAQVIDKLEDLYMGIQI